MERIVIGASSKDISPLLFIIFFIVPTFQDYNSKNFPKYEIVKFITYEVEYGDTLSEIAQKDRPKYIN